ncbi:MAG: helix-turn-helix domain-containing protein [Terracidiphilus sp.]
MSVPTSSRLSLADRIEAYDHALTAQELAACLDCSDSNIYNQARAGRILHIRFGGSIRFDPHVTAEWLREHEVDIAASSDHLQRAMVLNPVAAGRAPAVPAMALVTGSQYLAEAFTPACRSGTERDVRLGPEAGLPLR